MDRFIKKLKIEESFDYNFSYINDKLDYDEEDAILDLFYNFEKRGD